MKKLLSVLVVVMLVSSFRICMASEEIYIPDTEPRHPVSLIPVDELVQGSITITEGWNLIAMPVLPVEPYTIKRFIEIVKTSNIGDIELHNKSAISNFKTDRKTLTRGNRCEGRSDWEIPVVLVYKNGRFEKYPKKNITYNMVPGEAYFVYARYNGRRCATYDMDKMEFITPRPTTSITILGKPLNVPISLNLNRGLNGASFLSKQPAGSLGNEGPSLYHFSSELRDQRIKAVRIAFWSATDQQWEQYSLPIDTPIETNGLIKGLLPADRMVRTDEGFFLLCEENGLFIPDLQMGAEPPVPPFPPIVEQREIYTGRIEYTIQLMYYREAKPYRFQLVVPQKDADDKIIPLQGMNDTMECELEAAASVSDNECSVEGVIKTLRYPYDPERTVDVLIVDRIAHIAQPIAY